MAAAPLHLDRLCRGAARLAAGRTVAAVPLAVHVLQRLHQPGAVHAVPLPEGRAVPAEGARRAAQHGHHDRGLPLVDVARAQVSLPVPVRRLSVPVLQRVDALPSHAAPGRDLAGTRAANGSKTATLVKSTLTLKLALSRPDTDTGAEHSVPHSVRGQQLHHADGHPAEANGAHREPIPADEPDRIETTKDHRTGKHKRKTIA